MDHLERQRTDCGPDREVAADQLVGRRQAPGDQCPSCTEDRVTRLVLTNRGRRSVTRFDVGSGVPHEAHGAQVQERRSAAGAHLVSECGGGVEHGLRVRPVDQPVVQARSVTERRFDPARRGRDADPEPVVLTHQQQRDRQAAVGYVAGGVDRALGGRVVGAGIAERAHRERIGGPVGRHAESTRPADRERHAERARQLRGDRRGLWDHTEGVVPEHLVAPAGDRILGQRQHPCQHVAHRLMSGSLLGAGAVEPARAIVQQCRVGEPQGGGDCRVALVTTRSDRVVPMPLGPQPASTVVEHTALHLGREDLGQRGGRRRLGR